jgi:hypothetical protein
LLKDDRWYRAQSLSAPGDFIGAIAITEAGTYTPLVTNATARDHARNQFAISQFGIAAPH